MASRPVSLMLQLAGLKVCLWACPLCLDVLVWCGIRCGSRSRWLPFALKSRAVKNSVEALLLACLHNKPSLLVLL